MHVTIIKSYFKAANTSIIHE